MSKPELDNLVRIERLKTEPPTPNEYLGMVAAARSRLTDAQNEDIDPDSRRRTCKSFCKRTTSGT